MGTYFIQGARAESGLMNVLLHVALLCWLMSYLPLPMEAYAHIRRIAESRSFLGVVYIVQCFQSGVPSCFLAFQIAFLPITAGRTERNIGITKLNLCFGHRNDELMQRAELHAGESYSMNHFVITTIRKG
ncbi:hypothetical protein AKJ16_DCAP15010 [Drosera capensis]